MLQDMITMWDTLDPVRHAYATAPDLDAWIARGHGDPAYRGQTICWSLRLPAGCPVAERKERTKPTGGASPQHSSQEVSVSNAQLRLFPWEGRADALNRRRQERDRFLGRRGKPRQSLTRKGSRQTHYRGLVQPTPQGKFTLPDARHQAIEPLACRRSPERQATKRTKKTDPFSLRPGCALLTFEDI